MHPFLVPDVPGRRVDRRSRGQHLDGRAYPDLGAPAGPGDFTDFGTMVQDLPLKDYPPLAGPRVSAMVGARNRTWSEPR